MSIALMSAIWKASPAKGSGLLLLLAIADFANDDGVAYPAIATLAAKTRLSERNVQYLLRQLEEEGELRTEPGTGPKGCNTYVILQGANFAGVQPSVKGVQSSAGGVQPIAPGGCNPASKGVQPIAPDPSRTTIEPPIGTTKEPPAAAAADSDEAVGRLCRSWEDATGTLVSRMLGDDLALALETYPENWIADAIRETGLASSRSWKYTAAVLDRWGREGREVAPGKDDPTSQFKTSRFRRATGLYGDPK